MLGVLAAKQGLTLRGVGVNPTRTGLLDLLIQMGADIRVAARAGRAGRERIGEPIADIEVRQSRLGHHGAGVHDPHDHR